jgi:hypothetical protein
MAGTGDSQSHLHTFVLPAIFDVTTVFDTVIGALPVHRRHLPQKRRDAAKRDTAHRRPGNQQPASRLQQRQPLGI